MTSKLKCPFCGEKLYSSDNCYVCLNDDCIFCGFHFMEKHWKPIIELKQALIQAKQDLETARKALKEIKKHNKAMHSVLGEQIPEKSTDIEEYCWWASCRIQDCLNALEQIEHKEQQK